MMPMAVPGLVLGIGYILFFNHPANPLNFLYGTMAILVLCTVIHFYSSSHLTAVTALKQLDNEFESVSASLKVPFYKTFWRVTVPVCLRRCRHQPLLLRQCDDHDSCVVFLAGRDRCGIDPATRQANRCQPRR
jgi:ABC-type Fe3+ transport system permease subunit